MSEKIRLFENPAACCGCSACAAICPKNAISMHENAEGFLYPQIDDARCIACKRCIAVCPLRRRTEEKRAQLRQPHVGIINLQYTNNYGASIAAAVLEDTVRQLLSGTGVRVQTVHYAPDFGSGSLPKRLLDEYRYAGSLSEFWKSLKGRYGYRGRTSAPQEQKRQQRFTLFSDKYMDLTPPVTNAAQIIGDTNYVAFIAGSDVIWHPQRVRSSRAAGYFLQFAGDGVRKIAYAPSLDCSDAATLQKLKKQYQNGISGFDFLSVREAANVPFLQSLTEKAVQVCCDPAFLYTPVQYDGMLADADLEMPEEPYIYVYTLSDSPRLVEYAKRLSAQKGMPIYYYAPNGGDFGSDAVSCVTDGPCEFLRRIRDAAYVLTNSYHCTVFSVLFEKPFLCFFRSKTGNKTQALLETLGLHDRMDTTENTADADAPIDFAAVQSKVAAMREAGLRYLRQATAGLPEKAPADAAAD